MNDDYLWDRSGEPDPEVVRLERLLGRYKHEAPLGVVQASGLPPSRRRDARTTRRWLLAAAAAIVLIAAGVFAFRFHWNSGQPWEIETVDGRPIIDGELVSRHDRLGVGDTLVTDSRSRVTLRIARLGELEIAPNTEMRLVATGSRRHRIELRRGSINARVWAPPFTFGVETPAGLASDIGCAFNLRYSGEAGLLHVTSGWVDFDGDFRSSMVPGGAISELRRDLGPGTPYWVDAPQELRDTLRRYDATGTTADLKAVLAVARLRDAMTVQHMLERAEPHHRGMIFDHLNTLSPAPPGVTREGVIGGNIDMIDKWRKSLGIGGVKKWWIHWRDALPE